MSIHQLAQIVSTYRVWPALLFIGELLSIVDLRDKINREARDPMVPRGKETQWSREAN